MTDDSVGVDLCGVITYTIEPVSYTENKVTPLVSVQGTTITLHPTAVFAKGIYTLKIVGKLPNYPSIKLEKQFQVEVTIC